MSILHRLVDIRPDAPEWILDIAPALAEAVAQSVATSGRPAVVLRHQRPYVLLGPKDRRLPRLDEAVGWLQAQNLPVIVRVSGGSAVLLDRGCLSFAIIRPSRDLTVWQRNFAEMCQGIIRGLRRLGVAAEFGEAPGSYCPGPYDLLVGGKKIAGVAQAIRAGYAMVSGMILVHQDPDRTTHLIRQFYERAGQPKTYQSDAVTRLDALVPITMNEVHDALIDGFAEELGLEPEDLTTAERLLATHRVAERTLPGLERSEKWS